MNAAEGSTVMYNIDGGAYQLDNEFRYLSTGVYTVGAKMYLGMDTCYTSVLAIVNNKTPGSSDLNISVSNIIPVSCIGGSNGRATITVSGFSYTGILLDGMPITNGQTVSGLTAGTHIITVLFDSEGCTVAQTISTFEIPESSGMAISVASQTNTTCGAATGAVTISVSPAGTYSLSSVSGIVNGMTVSDLPAGIHEIVVTSFNGCMETVIVVISNTNMSGGVDISATGAACEGSHGEYRLSVTGSITTIRVDGKLISGAGIYEAGEGMHYVEYIDVNGCVGYDTFVISGGIALSLNYAVSDGDCQSTDLSLDVVVTGGVAPYTVNGISTFNGVLTLFDLSAGHTVLVVEDANGCIRTFEFDMQIGHADMISDTGIVAEICSGMVFTYEPESNVPGTTYSWTRYAVAGIEEDYATGMGGISETLTNSLNIPVRVLYEYILVGTGACYLPDTVLVEVIVNPVSALLTSHTPSNGSRVVLGNPVIVSAMEVTGVSIVSYEFTEESGRMTRQTSDPLDPHYRFDHHELEITSFNEKILNTIAIVAENEYGCISEATETFIAEYDVPSVITPNDGPDANRRLLPGYDVQVFNRWGSELYRGTNGWDGRYRGSLVAQGTYLYILRFTQPNGQQLIVKRSVYVQY
jgi:hypothetical protein